MCFSDGILFKINKELSLMLSAAFSKVYCVIVLFNRMKGRTRSEEATGEQEDKEASKQLVINSYITENMRKTQINPCSLRKARPHALCR